MLAEIINTWDMIYYSLQGLSTVLVAVLKMCFTTPLLPFTLLMLIGLGIRLKAR